MATTTPNYGWTVPTSSDLVKNGATAIETLGDSVDDSLWSSGYGQAGKNKIINGDFTINQRAFTSTTATGYNFDRWRMTRSGGTITVSPQTFTLGAAPVAGYEGTNFCRLDVTGQSAAGDYAIETQYIENVRTFAGQTVTVSLWAKTNAAAAFAVDVYQDFGTGGSPSATVQVTGQKTATTTNWTRYSFTFAIPSISGKTLGANNNNFLALRIWASAGSTYNSQTNSLGTQTVTLDIWGVQVEYGSKATPFQTASGGSIQGELAMCQRYFERMVNGADNSSETIGVFQCFSTTQGYGTLRFVVPKRGTPSMTFSGNADFVVKDALGTNRATTLMATGTYSPRTANVTFTIGTASLLAGSAAWMLANSATATIDVSAEL
jgi:hypothetical protein